MNTTTTATPEGTAGGSVVIDPKILGILIFLAVLTFGIFCCVHAQREGYEERYFPFVRPRRTELPPEELPPEELGRSSR